MRLYLFFSILSFFSVTLFSQVNSGKTNCSPDTVYYTAVKSKLLINKNRKDSLNHWGKNKLKADLTNPVSVAQIYLNNDSVKVHGANIRMGAYNFSGGIYTSVKDPVKVTVYLFGIDDNTFLPNKKIDSVEINVLNDNLYTAVFPVQRLVKTNFAIGLKNTTFTSPISTSRIKVFANNATDTSFGEGLGCVQTPFNNKYGVWQLVSEYFDGVIPSSNTPYGYEIGAESDSLINWDWMIHPIISYSVKASSFTSKVNPQNLDEVELSRSSKLTIGKNHLLTWSGFKYRYFKEKDSSYYWLSNNKVTMDSVFKFTMQQSFKGVQLKAKVLGYTSNCEDVKSYFGGVLSTQTDYSNISIFPNPVLSHLTVNIENVLSDISAIKICDFTGKVLVYKDLNIDDKRLVHEFDVDSFNPGIYFVIIENNSASFSFKLMKI